MNLHSPCVFCSYNGTDYWQEGSHPRECPWYFIGGKPARKTALPTVIHQQSKKLTQANKDIKELKDALGGLVWLKDYKDREGKTAYYDKNQPEAWRKARTALTGEGK